MHSFGGKRLQQASTDCLPTALLATSVLLNFRHCHGQLSSLGPPSLENQHLVETTTRGVRVFLPRRANQIARPLSGVWPWTPRCRLPRRLCRVSQQQQQSYRYGVLAVNFLISAIIFWKNTQCQCGHFAAMALAMCPVTNTIVIEGGTCSLSF